MSVRIAARTGTGLRGTMCNKTRPHAYDSSTTHTPVHKPPVEITSFVRDRSLDVSDGSEYVAMLRPGVRARLEAREGK